MTRAEHLLHGSRSSLQEANGGAREGAKAQARGLRGRVTSGTRICTPARCSTNEACDSVATMMAGVCSEHQGQCAPWRPCPGACEVASADEGSALSHLEPVTVQTSTQLSPVTLRSMGDKAEASAPNSSTLIANQAKKLR